MPTSSAKKQSSLMNFFKSNKTQPEESSHSDQGIAGGLTSDPQSMLIVNDATPIAKCQAKDKITAHCVPQSFEICESEKSDQRYEWLTDIRDADGNPKGNL